MRIRQEIQTLPRPGRLTSRPHSRGLHLSFRRVSQSYRDVSTQWNRKPETRGAVEPLCGLWYFASWVDNRPAGTARVRSLEGSRVRDAEGGPRAAVEDRRQTRILGSVAHDFAAGVGSAARNGIHRRSFDRDFKGSARRASCVSSILALVPARCCARCCRSSLTRAGSASIFQPTRQRWRSAILTHAACLSSAEIRVGDWTSGLEGRFDLIVSNPPYIPTADLPRLPCEVRHFDPWLALDGGFDGLAAYRQIIPGSRSLLAPGGWLIAEFGARQAPQVTKIANQCCFSDVVIYQDLAGADRVAAIRS